MQQEGIDITFNVFSDTPEGKDPDSFSPTLRKYHHILWNKRLPNGKIFSLDLDTPKLLHHKSELGEGTPIAMLEKCLISLNKYQKKN